MSKVQVSILVSGLLLGGITSTAGHRKPLPRPVLKKIEHAPTGTRLRPDPTTGQPVEYRVDGKITYDEKSGNFLLQWTGRDGTRKTIVYEPATKLDPVIAAGVEYDGKADRFRYSYGLSNLPTSRQKLTHLYLELRAPIQEVKAPDATWHSKPFTDFLREKFKVEGGWVWSQVMQGRIGLLPGEKAVGLSYLSSGLPAVVRCYAQPHPILVGIGEELPEELHAAIHREMWTIPYGVTVGPALPPQPFEPASFARRIIGMVDVSLQEGWIESPTVAQEIRTLLGNAVAALQRQDITQAASIVRTLLQRVEQENERTLLSEAYALLKFNLEFLQKQLGSR